MAGSAVPAVWCRVALTRCRALELLLLRRCHGTQRTPLCVGSLFPIRRLLVATAPTAAEADVLLVLDTALTEEPLAKRSTVASATAQTLTLSAPMPTWTLEAERSWPRTLRGSQFVSSPPTALPYASSSLPSLPSLGGIVRGGGAVRPHRSKSPGGLPRAAAVAVGAALAMEEAVATTHLRVTVTIVLLCHGDSIFSISIPGLLSVFVLVTFAVFDVTVVFTLRVDLLTVTVPAQRALDVYMDCLCVARPPRWTVAQCHHVLAGSAGGEGRCLAPGGGDGG